MIRVCKEYKYGLVYIRIRYVSNKGRNIYKVKVFIKYKVYCIS